MAKLGDVKLAVATEGPAQSLIASSRELGVERLLADMHGKPAAGKTFAALQRSEFWPKEYGKKWVKLEDSLWLAADKGAVHGALELKIDVPVIDMSTLLAAADPEANPSMSVLDVLSRCLDDAHNYIVKNKVAHLCVDTASKIDRAVCRFWEVNGPCTKSGARDSFAIWRAVCNTHSRFAEGLAAMPCDVTALFHSKPRSESNQMDAKTQAAGLATGGDIVFDVAYEDTRNIYRRDASMVFVIDRYEEGGQVRRAMYCEPHQGREAKNRFEATFPPGEALPPSLGFVRQKLDAMLKSK